MLLQTILITYGLLQFENKSNFPTEYIVPVITFLLVKYLLGDWDVGYQWSSSDVMYVLSILGVSYTTIKIVHKV
jgi:hypothetical protein